MSKFASFSAFAQSELKVSRERFASGVLAEDKGRNTQFVACMVACGTSLVTYGQQGNKPGSVEQYAGTTGKEIAEYLVEGTKAKLSTTEQYLSNALSIVARGGKRFDQKVSDAARRGDAVFLEAWIAEKGGIFALRAAWKGKGRGADQNVPTRMQRISALIVKEAEETGRKPVALIMTLIKGLGKDAKAELVSLLTKKR